MNYGDYLYIWQAPNWPQWRYDLAVLARPLAEVSRAQGLLLGRLADVGAALRDQASLVALTDVGQNTSISRINAKLEAFPAWNAASIEKRHAMLIALAQDVWKTTAIDV